LSQLKPPEKYAIDLPVQKMRAADADSNPLSAGGPGTPRDGVFIAVSLRPGGINLLHRRIFCIFPAGRRTQLFLFSLLFQDVAATGQAVAGIERPLVGQKTLLTDGTPPVILAA
jgi:hypothetical protein